MEMTGIASVGGITVICYLAAMLLKMTPLPCKWLPALCGLLGAGLGAAAYGTGMADYPAYDWLTAVAVGIVSGLAATGVHQVKKQLRPQPDAAERERPARQVQTAGKTAAQ